MISFRDMTFCNYWLECSKGKRCGRALTPKVMEEAIKWWGGEPALIAQFAGKPECFEEIEK